MKTPGNQSENGVALVMALCLLVLVTLLAGSAVILSQYAEMDSHTFASFTRSAYVAEGAGNRIYWLILNDRKNNPLRKVAPGVNESAPEIERFAADGTFRELKDYAEQDIGYRIIDAASGIDIAGSVPNRDLMTMFGGIELDSAEREKYEMIGNRLCDYVDSDDLTRLGGMEAEDYLAAGLPHLPRNQPFQFREEILWIPDIREICQPDAAGRMAGIRLIAPQGLPPVAGRPNLYATPVEQIAQRCRLSHLEAEQLDEAFSLWHSARTPLHDSLPAGFLKRLEMYYGTTESGFYTILIDASAAGQPGMRLAVTFRAETGNRKILEFYEYMLY